MAKHKKAKHAAKQASAAPSSHSSRSKFPTSWIVGAVVVIVVLILIFTRKAPEMPAPAAPEAVQPAPADEEVDTDEGVLVPSEVEVQSEMTGSRAGAYDPMVWEQGSFFGGIKCLKSTGFRTDVLEFQLKNKETFPVHLDYVKPGDVTTKNPTGFSVNGQRLSKGVKEACGTDVVEPGATATCTFEVPLRHFGPTGTKSANILQLKIRTSDKKLTSQTEFFC
ncbi:MAG: hypothetical protein Q7R76_02420 [Candidatus Woesearchaeota archaeon]|nr:hypothetical protein [Candidatus Woesearchaeota archaeon]